MLRASFIVGTLVAVVARAAAAASCGGAPIAGQVELPGAPFKLAVSPDGCWIYASLAGQGQTGIAILKRSPGGAVSMASLLNTDAPVTGLALTHDGSTLVATHSKGVFIIDTYKARSSDNKKTTILQSIDEDSPTLSVYANITGDDKTVFVSNERAHSITVIDLASRAIVGRIPTGNAPIALTFSPDERWLYTTSQAAMVDWNWPAACDAEDRTAAAGAAKHPKGAVLIIDVAIARKDPAHAVASRVEAGCNPVRLAISPYGDRAYVTARKDNVVLVFDTARWTKIAEIPVGVAPVPVAVVDGGKTILVGNSNRFEEKNSPESISVIDAVTNRVRRTLSAGAFPRDIVSSPDQRTVYVANFGSKTIDVRDVEAVRRAR